LGPTERDAPLEKHAVISRCGSFRYLLTRRWGDGPALAFLMLNPSTADASVDDPTIRKCLGFARRYGFNAIEVVNLFAFRATKPRNLFAADDPVGPDNDRYIHRTAKANRQIVCAWGPNASRMPRAPRVTKTLVKMGVRLKCLHVTKDGSPGHPLILSYDRPLLDYKPSDQMPR
jgi:hypothetical protein